MAAVMRLGRAGYLTRMRRFSRFLTRKTLSIEPRCGFGTATSSNSNEIQDLKERCDKGDADAGYALAKIYKGEKKDFKRAAEYFLISGKMGHSKAMTEIGSMCLIGYGMEKNAELAYSWFQKAASKGESEAQVRMAEMHRKGIGDGGLDYMKAYNLFSKAAKEGNPRGQFGLGDMYLRGQHVRQDVAKGYEMIQKAAEQGFADAQFTLGVLFATKAIPTTVLTEAQIDKRIHVAHAEFWLKLAGDQQHRDALGRLSELYNRALSPTAGSPENQAHLAFKYSRLAAETGLASAQRDLGFILLNGREEAGIEADAPKSMSWLFYASQQGYPDAAFAVGYIMSIAPTADVHSKQLREMFDQATTESKDGLGLGFTLCLDELSPPPAFNHTRVRALLLQDPSNAKKWLDQFQNANSGKPWDGGLHGGLNGLFAHPGVNV